MNIKSLIAFVVLIAIGIFGYSYYSSKKHEERLAIMKAESAKVQAETARLEADQEEIAHQKEIVKTASEEINMLSPIGKSLLLQKIPDADKQDFSPKNSIDEEQGRNKLKELMRRWVDSTELASRTARIALPNVVKSLQDEKRELEDMNLTPCLTLAQAHLYSAMDAQVNAYLEFMSKNEVGSNEYLKQGTNDLGKFNSKISRCQ